MAHKTLFLVLFASYALISEAQLDSSEGNNSTLPVSYPARYLQRENGVTCPNSEVLQETRYNITNDVRVIIQDSVLPIVDDTIVYTPQCPCMPQGRRVVYLDMTDPAQTCPEGWREISSPRTCGRFNNPACDSAFFPTDGISYSQVCGRVKAYRFSSDIFAFYESRGPANSLDLHYVDGVSITYGSPRQHVWTFAAAHAESNTNPLETCPCTRTDDVDASTPSYIGEDYFCDSVATAPPPGEFNTDNPLWDGAGCGSISTCCEFNDPPWFCRTLPEPTTDDIEIRICGFNNPYTDGDTPVEMIELYVS